MVAEMKGFDRLVDVLQNEGENRTRELTELANQMEQRNKLLEQQLRRKGKTTAVVAVLAVCLALGVGAWVYLLMREMANDVSDMSSQIGQMQTYMRNMGAGHLTTGSPGFMSIIAGNTDTMSENIGTMRMAMQQVSGDIADLRVDMRQMRDDIGSMGKGIMGIGSNIKEVGDNIATMTQSVGHMNRNVGRMSHDTPYMRDPMRAMDSVMPWR